VALVLFFFSLSLLPAVELYCRLIKPAIVLLILQFALAVVRLRIRIHEPSIPLKIASMVFVALGVLFNAVLLISAHGRC
jgi:hypothetical protein